jgi:hypothetical protein
MWYLKGEYVWCVLLLACVVGPFFLVESSITEGIYLDLLEQFVLH